MRKSSILTKGNNFVLLGIIYLILLQYMYRYIYQTFRYYGFAYDFNYIRCVIAYILSIMIFILIGKSWNKYQQFSKTILEFIFFANAIPCLLLYIYMPADFILMLITFYVFLIIFDLIIPEIHFKVSKGAKKFHLNLIISMVFALFFLVTVYVWARYAHFNIQISILDVYDTRLEARTYSMLPILSYILSMAENIFPLIAVICLEKKKYFMLFLCVAGQFLKFSISAQKSTFFLMVFGIGIYYVVKSGKDLMKCTAVAFCAGGFLGIIEKFVFNTTIIIDTFYRRILMIPALLNYQYYEFFRDNGFDFYRQSIGKLFGLQSKYSLSLAFTIGSKYHNASMRANNGLFSDAYSNLGILGMILIPFLIILVLKIADGGTNRIPKQIWAVSALQFYFSFVGAGFFTALLTHGVLLVILLFYMMNEQFEPSDGGSI